MYRLAVSDGKRLHTVCTCGDKGTIEGLANNLNMFFNEHEDINKNISLKAFLKDDSNSYYLRKVLDYFAPGIGTIIVMSSLANLSRRSDIILSENMWQVNKTCWRKYKIRKAT